MPTGLLVRLRPRGPWRIGPISGARDTVDSIYHSDSLFSAVCAAMQRLGFLEDWLEATARASGSPAVRFSSCFPFHGETLFVVPPSGLWPPGPSARLRSKGAQFAPLSVVADILAGRALDEDAWAVDGTSACLVPRDRLAAGGPLRPAVRSGAAVDRLGAGVEPHRVACLEFAESAGFWTLVAFSSEETSLRWTQPVQAAFRLLADSGFGGERSRGWGRADTPEFTAGDLAGLLLPPSDAGPAGGAEASPPVDTGWWLLSLFCPGGEDSIDWRRGSYSMVVRGGRVESPARWGEPKKMLRMVAEGSVLVSASPPVGGAPDVAPEGFPHPVFRAGFAVALPIPWRGVS